MQLRFIYILAFAFGTGLLQAQPFYNKVIYVRPDLYEGLRFPINDLKTHLEAATGQVFGINTADSTSQTGIRISRITDTRSTVKVQQLAQMKGEAVFLESDGKTFLQIVGASNQALADGIYTFLDTLGFKWYHPGNDWVHVPALSDIRIRLNTIYAPDFSVRSFFGTFGTQRNNVIDPKKTVDGSWSIWSKRNRLTSNPLAGHMWNEFLWRNLKTLKEHPEYMAMVSGARVKPNTAAKFCVSNTGLQNLFVADLTNRLKATMEKDPKASEYILSVEPSDGDGHCECDKCKKLGSVSTRVFLLANLVAKEFQKISAKASVNLYAYNKHAAPPSLTLEKNVLVQIIPYKYQDYADPEKMVEDWKKISPNLYLYDYYGLPLTNFDRPLSEGEGVYGLIKKIRYWKAQRIKGLTLETSHGMGCTGPGLFMYSQLSWNTGIDADKVLKEYYKNCYGAAADAVMQCEASLAESRGADGALEEAMKALQAQTAQLQLADDHAKRFTHYKAYLHYLKLFNAFQLSEKENAIEAADKLLYFVYGTFFRSMVHTFPVAHYLQNDYRTSAYMKESWDSKTVSVSKYTAVVQWTDEQVEKAFEEDCNSEW